MLHALPWLGWRCARLSRGCHQQRETCGEGVAQPVDEGAAGAVGVYARAAKRAQHPVLQGAAGDALTFGAHEQRSRRRLAANPPPGEERRLAVAGKRTAHPFRR